ncbi:MAG: hypothetical protein K8T26_19470 [Lentisphaerae bacterium]|nr:hypothetical protein [Lentisphaerota bacterium]
MPTLVVERDMRGELVDLPESVRCVLHEAARLNLIPSATRLFEVPGLAPTIQQMTAFLHTLTAQGMSACASQGVPEKGLLVMRNSCIVAFGKACEAAFLVFRDKTPTPKFDIMLDPRRLEMPDLMDAGFVPAPLPQTVEFLSTFWSEFDGDTKLGRDELRQIGGNSAFGACLFFAHRDFMFTAHEQREFTESETQDEMRATLEYVLRVGISFALNHTLKVLDDSHRTINLGYPKTPEKKRRWWQP